MSFHHCFRSDLLVQVYVDTTMIRLSTFLITGVCVGFLFLLWALSVLYHHRKRGGRISFITIFLLLSDLLELILSPVILAYMIKKASAPCLFFRLLFGVRLCGHILHQLVAVEGILTQKYPLFVIFSPACSVALCIIVWLLAIVCQVIPTYLNDIVNKINMYSCVLPVIVCAITCLVTCKVPSETKQTTCSKPGMLILSIALFTLIILYVPYLVTYYTDFPLILDPLASMRLISEPLLCAVICKENHMVQKASRANRSNNNK